MRPGEHEHRANVDEPVPSAEDELENEKSLVSLSRPWVLSGSVGRGLANLKPGASSSRRAQSQQGQEQGHERPEQGGQDAPPLGELLEGQQPEQGENAGDRHTKQTFIESLGEPIDAQHATRRTRSGRASSWKGTWGSAGRTASETTALGATRLEVLFWVQNAGQREWVCEATSRQKASFRVCEATSTGSARRPRREKVSDRTNKKGSRRPSCAERLTSA